MDAFVYQSLPIRVIFGWNRIDALAEEIERLGARRALILTTPEQRELGERIAGLLGERSAGVYPQAVMHVPVEVAQAACEEAKRLGAIIRAKNIVLQLEPPFGSIAIGLILLGVADIVPGHEHTIGSRRIIGGAVDLLLR